MKLNMHFGWLAAVALLVPLSALADASCSATNQGTPPQTCSVTCQTPQSALCSNGAGTSLPFCACVGSFTPPVTAPTTPLLPNIGTGIR